MNDEINEILYILKVHNALADEEDTILLKYITNLQHIEDLYNQLLKDYDGLQVRIEKAVEYIKDNAKYQKATINNNKYYSEYLINQVLDILNGRRI